jgi:hypothetical protein
VPSPYVIAYLGAGALGLVYLVILHFMFERLASHHPNEWERLGCPEFFSNLQLGTLWRVLRFLGSGGHRSLNDPLLTALARSSLIVLMVVMGVSIYLQVVFIENGDRWPGTV